MDLVAVKNEVPDFVRNDQPGPRIVLRRLMPYGFAYKELARLDVHQRLFWFIVTDHLDIYSTSLSGQLRKNDALKKCGHVKPVSVRRLRIGATPLCRSVCRIDWPQRPDLKVAG